MSELTRPGAGPLTRWLGAALVAASVGAPALADTVLLKDGTEIEGRVVDRGDDSILLEKKHGSIQILRKDIVRISIDKDAAKEKRDYDVLILRDGNYVRGDIEISKDGAEVIVRYGKQGQVKHPRAAVAVIHWRDGREEVTDPSKPGSDALAKKIERLLGDLRKNDATGKPDLATRGEARKELLAVGVFARKLIASMRSGRHQDAAKEILADLVQLEQVRRVLPSKLEKKLPRLGERLISPLPTERETALRSAVLESPSEVGPLLLHVVKNDGEPRLRAYAVSQLSALRRHEELAEVLKVPDGAMRLAAAFALGDSGIYVGIPILIRALRIENLDIRRAALAKLRAYTKQHFGFRPKASKEDREQAIARWDEWWIKDGKALALQSIKDSAPGVEGARVSDAERKAALELWRQASEIVSNVNKELKPVGKTEVAKKAWLTKEGKRRRQALMQAIVVLDRALDLDPSLTSARLTRATLYYEELDRPGQAKRELQRILERAKHDAKDPDAARRYAYYHLGEIAMREKAYRRASVAFGQSLDYDSDFLDSRVRQGDAYFELALSEAGQDKASKEARSESFEAASVAFRAALASLAKEDKALVELVKTLRGRNKGVEESQVIQSVRKNRRSISERRATVHFRLGRLQAARGNDTLALSSYRDALREDPENERYQKAVAFWERLQSRQGK